VEGVGCRVVHDKVAVRDALVRRKVHQILHLQFRASGFGFRVLGFGFRVSGFGFRVPGSGFRVPGSGFRVPGFGIRVRRRSMRFPPAGNASVLFSR